jgi:capsular polysaccharide biosynthesis protein
MTPQRFFSVLKRHSLVVIAVFAAGLTLMFLLRDAVPNSFFGVAHVVLVSDSGARDPAVTINDLPSIATSTVVLERIRNRMRLPMPLIDMKKDVAASVLGRSSIMSISFRDESADRAIGVSNAVADELSRYYDEISTQRYDVNVDRLSKELTAAAQRIRNIEQQLGVVVAQNPFVVSDQSYSGLTSQIATLRAQRADAVALLQGDRAIANTLAPSPEISKTARHEILAGDQTYTAVQNAVARDTEQLAGAQAGYTKDFPGLPGAIAKVEADKKFADQVAQRALADPNAFSASEAGTVAQRVHQAAVVMGDQAHVDQLDRLIASQQGSVNDYPSVGKEYDQLRAQRDALQSEYTALANRRANALGNRAEASSLGSVVVLDRAIKADTKVSGTRVRVAILAFVLVLIFALGSAFLVEALDPRIRRREEVEELYGIPVVARFGARA